MLNKNNDNKKGKISGAQCIYCPRTNARPDKPNLPKLR